MAVLDPLKVVITNYPDGDGEQLSAPWHPQQAAMGTREMPFGREIFIERDDFALEPPPKWKRLAPGDIVRLRYAYIIRCEEVVRDAGGRVVELRATYVPASKSGSDTSGLKPKGVVHWVSATASVPAEVRLYEQLFTEPNPAKLSLATSLNPHSLAVKQARLEPAIVASREARFQFERQGYFCKDPVDHRPGHAVFNRIVSLKEGFSKA
jgi:glutaminyl-tRNA synthetase